MEERLRSAVTRKEKGENKRFDGGKGREGEVQWKEVTMIAYS
jgi:hypothetical protein